MDNQINFSAPQELIITPEAKPPHKSVSHWLVVSFAIVVVVGYFMASYYYALWPFGDLLKPIPTANPVQALSYMNDEYGFKIPLPDTWNGYSVLNKEWEGWNVTTGESVLKGPLLVLRHPAWTEQNQYEDMPVMVFTPEVWSSVEEGTLSVSAAPIPPTILGQNSKYIIALPARYNYDYKTGWEEADRVIRTLEVFEPVPSTSSGQADTSSWKTYRNEEYGFEFKYPDIYPIREYPGRAVLLKLEWEPHADYFEVRFQNRTIAEIGIREEILSSIAKEDICKKDGECMKYVQKLKNIRDGILVQHADGTVYYNYNNDVLITISAASPSLWEEDNDDFDQILSTFKFIK